MSRYRGAGQPYFLPERGNVFVGVVRIHVLEAGFRPFIAAVNHASSQGRSRSSPYYAAHCLPGTA
jgi:hypothetical protein